MRVTVTPVNSIGVRGTTTFVGSANVSAQVSQASSTANAAFIYANSAFTKANSAYTIASSASADGLAFAIALG